MNGRTNNRKPLFVAIVMLGLLLCSTEAFSAINNAGVMDTVLNRFKTNASSWASIIETVATRLFWTLVLISMVWTFGMMALRKADIGEFFAELVRFTVFTGFFWWLLVNGPNFAMSIIDSLMQVGGSAAAVGGYSGSFSPSSIVDIGFILFGKTLVESSIWSPVDSMIGIVLGLGILILTAMIAVNMLLLLISAWILAYGGIFFLGFGGARWTHDMAINYYKAVLGIAIQIMTMILLIGIGVSLINDYYTNMQTNIEFSEMAVVLIVTLTIFMLSNKVPQLLSGIITGHAPSGMGIGQFGAGAALGATATAAAATAMAGSMISSGATQGAGGMAALLAAYQQANANVASGSDILANTFSSGGDSGPSGDGGGAPGGGSPLPESGETPFAKAAGFSANNGASASPVSAGSGAESTPAVAQEQSSKTDGANAGASEKSGESSGGNKGGGFGSMGAAIATATRVGADTAANLAKGSTSVAKDKIDSVMDSAKERIADTTGGRIADAIRAMGADSSGTAENSLASVEPNQVDTESEVAAFVNRDNDSKSA
ncbi:MAG: P-type conjugative transfer protein TrbL [Candidatus Thiodiazotropha sp.]